MAASSPTVIAHDVHVTYRTYGGRRHALATAGPSRFGRLMGRATEHVGSINVIPAVRGVSFVAHEGESIGVIGRNGSGKSTLLRAIAGLLPLESGQVYARGDIALMGVSAALMSSLTGERNIMLGGLAQGLTRRQVKEHRDEIVEFAGIGDFLHLPMRAYSSGMSARLRFAISSAVAPDILIIDEALATGDAEFREQSAARIEEIRGQAGTVFIVSHSASTIRKMCTRGIWLERGELMADGDPDDVVDAYEAFVKDLKARKQRKG